MMSGIVFRLPGETAIHAGFIAIREHSPIRSFPYLKKYQSDQMTEKKG
jgi:hypothetical protein